MKLRIRVETQVNDDTGVKLFFSNSVEELAAALAQCLKDDKPADLFQPTTVIVPNASLQKWLQLRLADHNGIAANIDFPFLEKGLRALVDELTGDQEDIMLGASEIQLMLIRYFKSADLTKILSMKRYLTKNDTILPEKLWQLSGQLAHLFLEYERNRPQMVSTWKKGKLYLQEESDLEEEQRLVYLSLFSNDEFARLKWKTLVQAAEPLFQKSFTANTHKTRNIYIFGPSQLSVFHRRLLCRLGEFFNITIFSLNVCSEFWQDVETPGEQKWLRSKLGKLDIIFDDEGEMLPDVDDNPLLKSWGKTGREALKIFSDLEDECTGLGIAFQSFWLPAPNEECNSVLSTIQNDILSRTSGDSGRETMPQDDSLQIAGAPGIFREVEIVYSSILTNMKNDPSLKLTDIAVLVPEIDSYKAAIAKVFDGQGERYSRPVPYSLIDSRAETDSLYANGILSLLEIFEGEFTRKEIFELFMNECFQVAAGLIQEDVDVWLKWADELNIYREFSSLYSLEGPQAEMFTFKQGARRLLLGEIMDLEDSSFKDISPFDSGGKTELAGKFLYYVEELARWRRDFNSTEHEVCDWQQKFVVIQQVFLDIPEGMNAESTIRARLNEAFSNLKTLSDKALDLAFSAADISFYVKGALNGIPASKGSYLGSGVTIASLQPMRPVPFKIIYVMGMGENQFPGSVLTSTLDLRSLKRKIGDISIPEKNTYLFLETLVCAREKLCLSYVSEDIQKDKIFNPSRIVFDLQEYFRKNISDCEFNITKIPLKHADPGCFQKADKCHQWLQSSSLEHALLTAMQIPGKESDSLISKLLPELKITDRSKLAITEKAFVRDIKIKELAGYLRNPAEAILKYFYRLDDYAKGDPALEEDEPFSVEGFKKKFFEEFVERFIDLSFIGDAPENIDELVSLMCLERQQRSEMPPGLFGELEFNKLTDEVNTLLSKTGLIELLRRLKAKGCHLIHEPGFGNIMSKSDQMVSKALEFSIEGKGIKVHGGTGRVCTVNGRITDLFVYFRYDGLKKNVLEILIEPFLFWAVAKIKGLTAEAVTVHVISKNDYVAVDFNLLDDDSEFSFGNDSDVKDWLQDLIGDYLNGKIDMLPASVMENTKIPQLPNEALIHSVKGPAHLCDIRNTFLGPGEEQLFDSEYQMNVLDQKGSTFAYTYNRLTEHLDPDIPKNSSQLLRKRFKILFELIERSKK